MLQKLKTLYLHSQNKTLHSRYSVMGLSLLGINFSSTIISSCTSDFRCADVRGVVAAECWWWWYWWWWWLSWTYGPWWWCVLLCSHVNLLIPGLALEAWLWVQPLPPISCQNSNISLAGMTDLQECHVCSWLQLLQICLVSTVSVLSWVCKIN